MIYHTTPTRPFTDGLWGTFDDLQDEVVMATRAVELHVTKFDAIAVQGVSGMSIGFPLALRLDKPIVVVRKAHEIVNDNSHSYDLVVGLRPSDMEGKRFLFVDDFVSNGTTRARVREAIEAEGGKLVAQYTTRDDAFQSL